MDLTIFCGHFGSGKTEVALNNIINRKINKQKVLIDLDVINPFFKASDLEEVLLKNNIELVKPLFAGTNAEVPALSPKVTGFITDKKSYVVIDVGGDDQGAVVLSCYSEIIKKRSYKMYCVVNTKRLFTKEVENIKKMVDEIENSSRLRIDGLINNTNLMENTTEQDIIDGQLIIEKVASELKKPIYLTTVLEKYKNLTNKFENDIMLLNKYVVTPIDEEFFGYIK